MDTRPLYALTRIKIANTSVTLRQGREQNPQLLTTYTPIQLAIVRINEWLMWPEALPSVCSVDKNDHTNKPYPLMFADGDPGLYVNPPLDGLGSGETGNVAEGWQKEGTQTIIRTSFCNPPETESRSLISDRTDSSMSRLSPSHSLILPSPSVSSLSSRGENILSQEGCVAFKCSW